MNDREAKIFEVAKSIFASKHAYFSHNNYNANEVRQIFKEAKNFVDDWEKFNNEMSYGVFK